MEQTSEGMLVKGIKVMGRLSVMERNLEGYIIEDLQKEWKNCGDSYFHKRDKHRVT